MQFLWLRWLNTTPQIASSKLNRRIVNQETIYLHRITSEQRCRRKAIHLTGFASPCPSALCLKILLRRNGGAGG